MSEQDNGTPVFLVDGFLESGKTSFVMQTVTADYFQIDDWTLLISCEEGEEIYDAKELEKYHTKLVVIDDEESFTESKLQALAESGYYERVIIEYNPLWGVDRLRQMKLPYDWEISQEILLIDGSTFGVYRMNMLSLFKEMAQGAELIIFNRCKKDDQLANYRRSFKVINPACDIIFEDADKNQIDLFEESVPYDMDAPVIEIEDTDFGIFYVDMQDHPDHYENKTVRFKARVLKSKKKDAPYFVPGRKAMTCCAEDTQMIGHICKSDMAQGLKQGEWVMVTAKVAIEFSPFYHGEGPVLYAQEIVSCDPPAEELVYFT